MMVIEFLPCGIKVAPLNMSLFKSYQRTHQSLFKSHPKELTNSQEPIQEIMMVFLISERRTTMQKHRQLNTVYVLMYLGHFYTPGIYADGYIVFAFPFVRWYVRFFVRFFVRNSGTFVEFMSKFWLKFL